MRRNPILISEGISLSLAQYSIPWSKIGFANILAWNQNETTTCSGPFAGSLSQYESLSKLPTLRTVYILSDLAESNVFDKLPH